MSVVVATGRELQRMTITLVPFPLRWKYSRLVVVHEGWTCGGFGGGTAASATEAAFDWLDALGARVGAPAASFGRHARCPWRAVCGPA
jgi:pyruvate/2-oxoglutarate/acetoin dehydrogenase E1 component